MNPNTPAYLQYEFPIEITQAAADNMDALVEEYNNECSSMEDLQFQKYLLFTYWSRMEDSQFKAVLYKTLQDLGVIKKPQ